MAGMQQQYHRHVHDLQFYQTSWYIWQGTNTDDTVLDDVSTSTLLGIWHACITRTFLTVCVLGHSNIIWEKKFLSYHLAHL